jgi:peptidoglycan hydrolase CwlO-like protein
MKNIFIILFIFLLLFYFLYVLNKKTIYERLTNENEVKSLVDSTQTQNIKCTNDQYAVYFLTQNIEKLEKRVSTIENQINEFKNAMTPKSG